MSDQTPDLFQTLQAGGVFPRYVQPRGVFVRVWLLQEPRKWAVIERAGAMFGLTYAGWGNDCVDGYYVSYQRRNKK